ncbi:MAG TPA: hypothetical protein VGM80_06785 [Gaiellaceae bacterium]|jgi:hypothetical protein
MSESPSREVASPGTPQPEPLAPAPLAPTPPDLMNDAVGPTPELSRRNTRLAILLTLLFLLLFGGTFAVGAAYLY